MHETALADALGFERKKAATSVAAILKHSDLLSSRDAAIYLGVQPGTLDIWRCLRRYRIPYVKIGRLVKYKKSALDEFIASRTVGAA